MTTDNEQTTLEPCPWCNAKPRELGHYFEVFHKPGCFLSDPGSQLTRKLIHADKFAAWNNRASAHSTAPVVDVDLVRCECGDLFGEHGKPPDGTPWDTCSFPCSKCGCQEFTAAASLAAPARCQCGAEKDDPIHSTSTEFQESHAFAATPSQPARDAEEFARQIVGTVFDNTAASHETLKQTMIERIASALPTATETVGETGGFTCDCCGRNMEVRINGKFCNECAGCHSAESVAVGGVELGQSSQT